MSPRVATVSARTAVQFEPTVLDSLDDLARMQKKPRSMVVREIVAMALPSYRQSVYQQMAQRNEPVGAIA